jgi:hypothetical protein
MSSSVPDQEIKPSFKEQLDHKAKLARDPNYGKEEPQPTLLEKGIFALFPDPGSLNSKDMNADEGLPAQ